MQYHAPTFTAIKRHHGFSLVELSIVLVILGLLTGGILSGQSLIRAAEIRALGEEIKSFAVQTSVFREKYHALPGDMKNATKFWGEADGDPSTCITTSTGDERTCDGDGNNALSEPEAFRYWQHLSNAGIGEYDVTGVAGPISESHTLIGENVPASRHLNIGYAFTFQHNLSSPIWFDDTKGNILLMGGKEPGWDNHPWTSFLGVDEAYLIDKKFDDGKATTGRYNAQKRNVTHCVTSDLETADYDFSEKGHVCSLIINGLF